MKTKEQRKILQIMPAGGWCLQYGERNDASDPPDPLVGWALVEEACGRRSVVGLTVVPHEDLDDGTEIEGGAGVELVDFNFMEPKSFYIY